MALGMGGAKAKKLKQEKNNSRDLADEEARGARWKGRPACDQCCAAKERVVVIYTEEDVSDGDGKAGSKHRRGSNTPKRDS